jgi:hypothetical protein
MRYGRKILAALAAFKVNIYTKKNISVRELSCPNTTKLHKFKGAM